MKKARPLVANSTDDLNELLSLTSDDAPKAAEEKATPESDFDALVVTPVEEAPQPNNTPVAEDDVDAEILALRAALAEPVKVTAPVETRPKPEHQLSAKEKELRDLKDQMARRRADELSSADSTYEDADGKEAILIHILEDGFTINGEVCYRGREIEFVVGGEAYRQTKDRYGKSWLDMTDDQQLVRWGACKFGMGPWPFRSLSKLTLAELPEGSTAEDLAAVHRAAAKRDRRAPVFVR